MKKPLCFTRNGRDGESSYRRPARRLHTRCNELLDDGRVLYGATRFAGSSKEALPSYTLVTDPDGVVGGHFRTLSEPWPLVRTLARGDLRRMMRPTHPRQARLRVGKLVARVLGAAESPVMLKIGGGGPDSIAASPERGVLSRSLGLNRNVGAS